MSLSIIKPTFAGGEISPSLWGRTDVARFHTGAATMRNMFVNYRGGASSRAGTAFVGACKQTGDIPPRLIPFSFNISQAYALEFGDLYMRVIYRGAYVTETPKTITALTNAAPGQFTIASHGFSNGDWVYLSGVAGTSGLNGQTGVVTSAATNTFTLVDVFGNAINTTASGTYTASSGTAARIYTLTTPWAIADVASLKFAQSADVMTIVHSSYPPYDLARTGAASWTLTSTFFTQSIAAPSACSAYANTHPTSGNPATDYQYVVTAIDAATGEESVASPIGEITDSVNIATQAGTNTIYWPPVSGASSYNIYKAPPAFNSGVPVGALFGYAGTAYGTQFNDNNITANFNKVPPRHKNPFAPGAITQVTVTNPGSGYTSAPSFVITTSAGTGAVFQAVIGTTAGTWTGGGDHTGSGGSVSTGTLVSVVVEDGGMNYAPGDTVAVTGGGGSGALATLTIGPTTGVNPGVVEYFQQRRVYGNSLNNPDTLWMSQPGAFTNFDTQTPVIDSDAITTTPWAKQVNGIQALVPMPGGLVVLTGLGAWQLTGGGQQTAVTPSSQNAQPQAYNGCNSTVLPIVINYDILYVQTKGSIVRDLAYNFFVNIYTGTDITVLSNHLFQGRQIVSWAWAEEPQKIVWCVRDDGTLISLTYLKEQEVIGWARHDTAGQFVSVCTISEPNVNIPYFIVKRFVNGQWMYYTERMDDRLWYSIDDVWCVDCGLSYPKTYPNATLTLSSSTGSQGIGSVNVITGGTNYSNPAVTIIDPTGSGAVLSASVSGGVITGISVTSAGSGYTSPRLVITDLLGGGASATATVDNSVTAISSSGVFSAGNIGSVIRSGGGIGTITDCLSSTQVTVSLTQNVTKVVPNDPSNTPLPVTSGNWSISVPTTTVSGLYHLEGKTVAILADGSVVPNQTVTNGTVTLPYSASNIVVGLPFQCQIQTLYLDVPGEATIQGKRKDCQAVTVRTEASRGVKVGTNQIDASTQANQAGQAWTNMIEIKERGNLISAGTAIPLYTGDHRIAVHSKWAKQGQIAIQQDYPLPLNITALVGEWTVGDDNG